MSRCPTCRKSAAPRRVNPFFPFCTERCKLVDLGRWLGEEYRIPARRDETDDAPPTLPPEDDDGSAR
jgi:hypothetical protein